ncbi:MAG: hypothetical protein Fur0026_07820 [Sideroxydans sp.]
MNLLKKLLLTASLLMPLLAHAIGEPYTQKKLDTLNQAGQPALVLIVADWCGTCRAQEKILGELLPGNEFKNITALRVDFDMQKDVVRRFHVRYQSTLIVFKGGAEVARVTAETDRDAIAALLRRAL